MRLIPVDSKLKNKLTERISSDSIYMHVPPVINTVYDFEYMDLADRGNAGSVRNKGSDF